MAVFHFFAYISRGIFPRRSVLTARTCITCTDMATAAPSPVVYHISPTKLIPNSHLPLLYFPGFFRPSAASLKGRDSPTNSDNTPRVDAAEVYDHFLSHGWETQWVAKYGLSQPSHYHPETHECMAVLTGPGRIRFGVADLDADWRKNTPLSRQAQEQRHGQKTAGSSETQWGGDSAGEGVYYEPGGVELTVHAGDAFIIPAGVAHKSYDPEHPGQGDSAAEAIALTGGGFHGVSGDDTRKAVQDCELSGFTMIGAYPEGKDWTWAEGGAHVGNFEKVWSVGKPKLDPLVGKEGGLNSLWE
ncbi:uncharacterized protein B0I36DRAFT_322315 [Microdochium trichocladiopsis]|uniref:Cupin type-1 domain-containing protein n=1 Tax=Microdochium trichocladiopsis TaxID=1682393 RepID=A0A9P9BMZ2_9PEZI|nr:uncharacterized protein B0I36DRAFT_322315 [Microdochium trichocladiopsis]KAH7030721.1 hypothetical protein B0I36DRAFT_322315 [Microdochium trichocladiopsis]